MVVAVTLGLVLAELHRNRSLWLDETYTARFVSLSWGELVHQTSSTDVHSVFTYLVTKAWAIVVGDSPTSLRLFSTVSILLAVALVVPLVRRLSGSRAALLVACGLMLNQAVFRQASVARGFGFFLLMSVTSTLLLMRALDEPSRGRWLAYVVVIPLLVFSQMVGSFILFGHCIAILISPSRRSWTAWLALSVSAASVAVLGVLLLRSTADPQSGLATSDVRRYSGLIKALLGNRLAVVLVLGGVLCLLVLAALAGRAAMLDTRMVALGVAPPIVMLCASFVKSLLNDRYWIALLPLAFALVATLVVQALDRGPALGRAAALVVVAALGVGGLASIVRHPEYVDQDWRGAVQLLAHHSMPGDVVVTPNSEDRTALDYYVLRHPGQVAAVPVLPGGSWGALPLDKLWPHADLDAAAIVNSVGNHDRVWVVDGRQLTDLQPLVVTTLRSLGFVAENAFVTDSEVRVVLTLFAR